MQVHVRESTIEMLALTELYVPPSVNIEKSISCIEYIFQLIELTKKRVIIESMRREQLPTVLGDVAAGIMCESTILLRSEVKVRRHLGGWMWAESILMQSVMAKPRSLHFDGVLFFELADLQSWCLSMPGTKICDFSPSSVSEESNMTSEWDVPQRRCM